MQTRNRLVTWALILMGINILVFGRWWLREGRYRKVGQTIKATVTFWEPARGLSLNWTNAYQAWQVRCPVKVKECGQWENLPIGSEVGFTGVWQASKTTGNQYLEVTKLINIDRSGSKLIWWRFLQGLHILREKILSTYRSTLSEPYASLLAGIVLGTKSNFPLDFYQALITTGTVHIVAASGYNISVLSGALIAILVIFFKRKRALLIALSGVGIYVILAGASPPVLRAGVMGTLLILSQLSGRLYSARLALFISILLMLVLWPWMLFSVSFLLSVAATMGIIFGSTKIKEWLTRLTKSQKKKSSQGKGWGESVAGDLTTTLAATLVTIPLIGIYFDRVSLIAPVVNVLVLWLVPPLMALGGIQAIVGLVSPVLVWPIAWITYPPLWLFVNIVNTLAQLPGASVEVKGIGWLVAVVWWGLLGVWWGRRATSN